VGHGGSNRNHGWTWWWLALIIVVYNVVCITKITSLLGHCFWSYEYLIAKATLNCFTSYHRSSDLCHLTPWRCWSRRSFDVAWTTAIHFSTAYPMDWWLGCSLSRMLLHVMCRALDGMTTSRRCYTSCTGFRFGSGRVDLKMATLVYATVRFPTWLWLTWSAGVWRRS